MSLTVKAFLEKNGKSDAEIRRFQVPADASSSFAYLHKKTCDIFPTLRSGKFTMYWKDPDGDRVSFSTDEELMEALAFVTDSTLKVYIRQTAESGETPSSEDQVHPGVVCDGCDGPIAGPRYKCMVCPDYDLCRSCEAKGIHVEHDMMKITTPSPFPGFPCFPGFPGFPGPQGPQGPQGGFVPPPHFRRWMRQFMRRWHNRNGEGKEEKKGDDSAEDDKAQGGSEEQKTQEEYLKSVGESVAAMLDPFGIDVDIDVETHDKPKQCGGKMRGGRGCGRGGGRGRGGCHWRGQGGQGGPGGPHNPWEAWGCGRMAGHPGCRRGKNKESAEDQAKGDAPTEPKPSSSAGDAMETEVPKAPAEQAQEAPVLMEAQGTDQSGQKSADQDNTWTLLTINGEQGQAAGPKPPSPQATAPPPTQPETQIPAPPVQQPPLYPPADPRIAEALQQMLAMGFNNDGGWLTHLLEAKEGDIVRVLDAIRPQAARRGEDGNMA